MLLVVSSSFDIPIHETNTNIDNQYLILLISMSSTSVFQLIMSMSMFFNPAPLQSNTQEILEKKHINGNLWNKCNLKSFNIGLHQLFQPGVISWHNLFSPQIAVLLKYTFD